MAERRNWPAGPSPSDPPPAPKGNGNGWKSIAIALISLMGTVIVIILMFTKGTATVEQMRDERAQSKEERAQSKAEGEGVWKGVKELDEKVTALTREADRRGGRVDRLEEALVRSEARLATLENAHSTLMQLKLQLEVLKDSVNRVDGQLRDLNERLQRRTEPSQEPQRSRLPRGFP